MSPSICTPCNTEEAEGLSAPEEAEDPVSKIIRKELALVKLSGFGRMIDWLLEQEKGLTPNKVHTSAEAPPYICMALKNLQTYRNTPEFAEIVQGS